MPSEKHNNNGAFGLLCGCRCLFVCTCESCMHISVTFPGIDLMFVCSGDCVCANVHETTQVLWQMPLSVWNAVGWIPPETVTRRTDHWRATDSLAPKGSNICGRKEIYVSENNNKWSTASLSLSISSSLTLSDLIPTLHLHSSVAAESASGDASLEKNDIAHSRLFLSMQITRNSSYPGLVKLRWVCHDE